MPQNSHPAGERNEEASRELNRGNDDRTKAVSPHIVLDVVLLPTGGTKQSVGVIPPAEAIDAFMASTAAMKQIVFGNSKTVDSEECASEEPSKGKNDKSKEGRIEVKEEETSQEGGPTLPLKNDAGKSVNVRRALAERYSLLALLNGHPRHFAALLCLALGQDVETNAKIRNYLKARKLLSEDGVSVCPEVRDILLSSYQKTPDGHHLGYPFAINGPEDLQIIENAEQQIRDFWATMLHGEEDSNKGRSR